MDRETEDREPHGRESTADAPAPFDDAAADDPDTEPPTPEIVAAADYVTGVIPLARPGVVVWLGDDAPDEDEVTRAASMRAHPANGSRAPNDADDPAVGSVGPGPHEDRIRHLRAVS